MSVLCESRNFAYKVCNVGGGTIDSVSLGVVESKAACVYFDGNYQNYNGEDGVFGYNTNSLWVFKGCRANFNVCFKGMFTCSLLDLNFTTI